MSQIVSVESIPLRIPRQSDSESRSAAPGDLPGSIYHRKPHRGLVYSRCRETVFIKITTDDGHVGWGETLASVAPQVASQIIDTLLAPQLVGQNPLEVESLWTSMYRSMRDRGHLTGFFSDALAGCDTALWDLRGQILRQPVYTLIGGPYTKSVPVYASGVHGDTATDRANSARKIVDDGFNAIKLHLTSGRHDLVDTVAVVRDAVGPEVSLMVDAHNAFDIAEAIQVGRALERYDVLFFEAPTDPENVAGLTELAATLQVRIATGESERSRFQFRDRLVARAVDVVQPDMGYVGFSEMRRIALLAETFHVPMAPHLSAGLGVCIAATIHLMASIPNALIMEYSPVSFPLANQFLKNPLECVSGHVRLPDGFGFGVELNEESLREYQVSSRNE